MPHSLSVTFDEIEGSAGRSIAFAVFITYARRGIQTVLAAMATFYLARRLRRFTRIIRPLMEHLSKEQSDEVFSLIEQLHNQLVVMLDKVGKRDLERFENLFFIGKSIVSIQESTEDFSDILDELVLSHDEEFKGIMAGAIRDLKSARDSLETVHN